MKKFLKILLLIIIYILIVLAILIKTDCININFVEKEKNKTIDEYIDNGLQLEDTSLSQSNEKMDTFYYNQLSDTAKLIYDTILENKEKMKNGTSEITFEKNTFKNILDEENGMEILSNEYQNAVDALRYDHVEIFYIDFSKIVLKTTTYTTGIKKSYEISISKMDNEENYFQENITNEEEAYALIEEIEKKSDDILENITGTNYQKIQYIHNWLVDNLQYDTTYSKENTRDIYGALIKNEVVCEGYAKSFKYLLDKLNIPCIIVSGEAINSEGQQEKHMWNYVKINEVWYAVDVTWDDPIILNANSLNEEHRYKYFCQGDNINENHFIDETITDGCQKWEYPELYHKAT